MRMPENPLPESLRYTTDGHVVPVPQAEQLHLHQDQVVHHHYAQALPSTGAQVGVALAQALGKAAPGLGWSIGGGTMLVFAGGMLGMTLITLAIAALAAAFAVHTLAGAVNSVRKPERPKPGKR